jgi:hypothetical protein
MTGNISRAGAPLSAIRHRCRYAREAVMGLLLTDPAKNARSVEIACKALATKTR